MTADKPSPGADASASPSAGGGATPDWLDLDDRQLLAQCEVHTYRASGPGGQKRNKTDSAVRLHHGPTKLIVVATESRSQHENKARALRRLRQAIALQVRRPVDRATFTPPAWFGEALGPDRQQRLSVKSPVYWHAARLALDVLDACAGAVAEAAALLGMSTAQLIRLIETDPKAWEQANRIRQRHRCKPLR